MSAPILIIGESGSGKTASLRNMDPARTLLIQALGKPLPFKPPPGWATFSKASPRGNIIVTDQAAEIVALMARTERDVIVIDDWQYVMANEFMRRVDEIGFKKFNEIGRSAWDTLLAASTQRADKRIYILTHSFTDEYGNVRAKTIGKMLDEKICVEGMFSIVLRTVVRDSRYLFATQTSGSDTCKSPMGLFAEHLIDNDLAVIDEQICRYYEFPVPRPLPRAA